MVCALMLLSASVHAQDAGPGLRPGRISISAGGVVNGGVTVGDVTGALRPNASGTPPPFTLVRARSAIDRAVGVETRVAVAITRRLAVEVGAAYLQPELVVSILQDPELAGGAVVSDRLSQFTVDLSGLYQLPRVALGSRIRTYVLGGGGFLRQLHEGRTLAENGRTFHAGGGLRYWLRGGSARQAAVGARLEARVVHRTGGIDFEGAARTYPSASLLVFAGF